MGGNWRQDKPALIGTFYLPSSNKQEQLDKLHTLIKECLETPEPLKMLNVQELQHRGWKEARQITVQSRQTQISEECEKFGKVRNELQKALKRNCTKMVYYQMIVNTFAKLYAGYYNRIMLS